MPLPKWWGLVGPVVVVLVILTLLPLAGIWIARATNSRVPRLSIISDMDNQPRYKAQMESPLFADKRAMRLPVAGTVPPGRPGIDAHLNLGVVDGEWATVLPPSIEITPEFLTRGQNRFDIYCAVCHGADGSGNGMIDARVQELLESNPQEIQQTSWVAPANYHTDQVRDRPVGHIFNTITNGIRNMPPYGKQLSVEDRWAVVAYVRALQRSQLAKLDDVPAEERQALEATMGEAMAAEEQAESGAAGAEDDSAASADESAAPAEETADDGAPAPEEEEQ